MANNRYSQVKAKRVTKGLAAGATGGGGSITVSDTAPAGPSAGDLWFDSTVLRTYVYYNDGSSSQWVLSNPVGLKGPAGADGSSVTVYDSAGVFSSSGNTAGDFAFASDTKSLYNWDGSEWDRISSGPQIGPRYTTTPTSTVNLDTSGATSTLTAVAVDESGFPITYDWDAYSGSTVYNAASLPPQLTNVSESNGVFTLTPSTSDSDAGNVTFRTKASDGVLFTPAITTLSLLFGESIVVPQQTTRGIAAAGTDEYSYNYGSITSGGNAAYSNLLDFHTLGTTFYFEVELQGNSGISDGFVGIVPEVAGDVGYTSSGQVSLYFYQNGAAKYPGNIATGFGVLSAGDKIGFKVTDGTSGPIVTMYLNGTADTGGSYTLTSGGSGRVKIWFGAGSGSGATHSGKFLSSASSHGQVQYLPTGAIEY
tara:strand:- start:2397 stop:3665 length:1269 start_codon:yes stop_codon:yes gene_type:complete